MNVLTTDQAGEILGVTGRRVRALIKAGRLPAIKFGNSWMINKKDLKKVAVRKPGRPPFNGGKHGKG
jgi:excisionase family DNA binding protein